MSEVSWPPSSAAWEKVEVNSTNRPDRVVDIIQEAWPTLPASMVPKGTRRVLGMVLPSTTVPKSRKSMSNPCLFSTILG